MRRKYYKENFIRNNMENIKKRRVALKGRGQATIWIIVAIVIVALIVIVFLLRDKLGLGGIFVGELAPNEYLRGCVEPKIKPVIETLSRQGGYEKPEGYFTYEGDRIKYLCYTDDYYETCVVQQPMIKNHFENELKDMLNGKLEPCMQSLAEEYRKRGYEVSSKEVKPEVSIIPGKIFIVFNSPLTIKKETTQSFNKFNVELESEMYDLLFIASSIIDYESSLGDSAVELYIQYYPNLRIEKIKLSEGTKIYKLSNVVSGDKFTFASRSLSWPAGYGLEGK